MKLGDLFRLNNSGRVGGLASSSVSAMAPPAVRPPVAGVPKPGGDVEMFLLELFLKPRQPATITGPGWGDLWAQRLGKSPQAVIDGMCRSGLLERPDLAGLLGCRYTVPQLKELGGSLRLTMRGKKDDLISSLVASPQAGQLEHSLAKFDALVCSERGRAIAGPSKELRAAERKEAEARSSAQLRAGRYEDACRTVMTNMAREPFGSAGMAHDVRGSAARVGEMLARLREVTPAEGEALVAAAMGYLWGDRPDRFLTRPETEKGAKRPRKTEEEKSAERAARFEVMRLNHAATLRNFRANRDVLVGVGILATGTSCDNCKAAEGTYSFDDVPPLPHERCRHEKGCRCCYVPVTRYS